MLWIAFAIVFIILLFFLKNKSVFKNSLDYARDKQEAGLTYKNEVLGNLVNKDADLDGVPDWEEFLWGTDPTKKDTNGDGVPDNVEIENLKQPTGQNQQGLPLLKSNDENLTETDKFSREFFATVATLNQNEAMDQATVDKLSSSLAEHIQNSPPRKVFVLSDIKVINNDSVQATKNYSDTLDNIYKNQPVNYTVIDVLRKFIIDENNATAEAGQVDVSVLSELDPIIEKTNKIIDGMIKMDVPKRFSLLHLSVINGFERSVENLNDIKLYDSDVIVALSAISQYEKNTTILESSGEELLNIIKQKLKN